MKVLTLSPESTYQEEFQNLMLITIRLNWFAWFSLSTLYLT